MSKPRYWAFLSYSHEDRAWGRWLHRALEGYVTPRRLVGRPTAFGPAPRRLTPIFRDREELAADSDLRGRVHDALEQSAFLIVVCSPAAARSPWVNQEIQWFRALHGDAQVLTVIVAGSAHAKDASAPQEDDCFPPALARRAVGEDDGANVGGSPLAADLRAGGDGRRLALLKLLAPMLGAQLDELVRRDAQRRHTQLAILSTSLGAVAIAMSGLATAALIAGAEARHQRAEAETLVEFMLTDLRKKLEPEGRLDVLGAVGVQAMNYYSRQSRHGMDADALGRRARVLHMLGEIDNIRGDLASALKRFEAAQSTTAELLARDPSNPHRLFEHAQSVFWVGEIARRRGQFATAEKQFQEYRRLADRLLAKDPKNQAWLAEVEYANSALGVMLVQTRHVDEGLAALRRAVEMSQALVRASPSDRDRLADLAGNFAWAADGEELAGADAEALKYRMAERKICFDLLQQSPIDNAAALELVVNRAKVAKMHLRSGRSADAIAEALQSVQEAQGLADHDRSNLQYRAEEAGAFNTLANAKFQAHELGSAEAARKTALALTESLVKPDQSVVGWNGLLLGENRLIGMEIEAAAARNVTQCRQALAPAAAEADRLTQLSLKQPYNADLARITAEADLLKGDYAAWSSDRSTAETAWHRALDTLDALSSGRSNGLDAQAIVIAQAAEQSLSDVKKMPWPTSSRWPGSCSRKLP